MFQTSFIYLIFAAVSLIVSSSLSSDSLSAAVDIEHDVFKNSKSSNLYKAAILKKVTADCSACYCLYTPETKVLF